jgi:23S rRNA pseudouridine1911/1915/1917 synthase
LGPGSPLFPRQALHARSLGFVHPATGEVLEFSSGLPDDLIRLTENLELL